MDIDAGDQGGVQGGDRLEEGLLAIKDRGGLNRGWVQEPVLVDQLAALGVFEGAVDGDEVDTLFGAYALAKRGGFDHLHLERQRKGFRRGTDIVRAYWWRIDKMSGLLSRKDAIKLQSFLVHEKGANGISTRLLRVRAAIRFVRGVELSGAELEHKDGFVKTVVPALQDFDLILMGETNEIYCDSKLLLTSGKGKSDTANQIMHSLLGLINRGIIILPGIDAEPALKPLEFTCPQMELALLETTTSRPKGKAPRPASKSTPPPKKARQGGGKAAPPPKPPKPRTIRLKKPSTTGPPKISIEFKLYVGRALGTYVSALQVYCNFERALETQHMQIVDRPPTENSLRRSIGRIQGAYGLLAMAKMGADLIMKGQLGIGKTLIVDGGTMAAGKKVEGVCLSECTGTDADGNQTFERTSLGAISLQNGTTQHCTERIFTYFEDVLWAVTELLEPLARAGWLDLAVDEQEEAEQPSLAQMLNTVRELLGDHGELGVLNATIEKIDSLFIDDDSTRNFPDLEKFLCHMHKVINFYEGAEKGMCSAETEELVLDEAEEEELAHQAEEFGGSAKRRAGQTVSSQLIRETNKLLGAHKHESLNRRKEFNALWDANGHTLLHWERTDNARGLQADFANAAPTLRVIVASMLSEGERDGGMLLIHAMAAKQGYFKDKMANRLHQSIADSYNAAKRDKDMTALCQAGAKVVLHCCLLHPYRALSNSGSQADLIVCLRELKAVAQEIVRNPRTLDRLAWKDAEKTRLVDYAKDAAAPKYHADDIQFAVHPFDGNAGFQEAYDAQMPAALKGAAQGLLDKIAALSDEKYGNILELNLKDPKVKTANERVEAGSTSIERMFGLYDHYLRTFLSSTTFTVNAWLIAHDQNMADVMFEIWQKDPELAEALFDAAMPLQEKLRSRWRQREKEDAERTAEELKEEADKRTQRQEERRKVVQEYKDMAEAGDFSPDAVSAELKALKPKKAKQDYLVNMCTRCLSCSHLGFCSSSDSDSFCWCSIKMYLYAFELNETAACRSFFYPCASSPSRLSLL